MFISQAYGCYHIQKENNSERERSSVNPANKKSNRLAKLKQNLNYKKRMFQSM